MVEKGSLPSQSKALDEFVDDLVRVAFPSDLNVVAKGVFSPKTGPNAEFSFIFDDKISFAAV